MERKIAGLKVCLKEHGRNLEVELRCSLDRKDFYLNGKKKQAHKIRGILPSVLFCPDDLNLIKGSQSVKRTQLDLLGSQISSGYNAVRKDYRKNIASKE